VLPNDDRAQTNIEDYGGNPAFGDVMTNT
jgi:hypothetical protein